MKGRNPDKPLRYTDVDHVVITTAGRQGKTKLHAFIRVAAGHWKLFTPPSPKQRRRYEQTRNQFEAKHRAEIEHAQTTGLWDKTSDSYIDGSARIHRAFWPSSGDVHHFDSLGAARVDLGAGVTPQGSTLAVILEAVHGAGQTEVDRDGLKVVLSRLGSRITQLAKLPDEQRQQARNALYSQIVATLY